MNPFDIAIIALLVVIVFFALRRIIVKRGACSCGASGCSGCACGCENCPHACMRTEKAPEKAPDLQ